MPIIAYLGSTIKEYNESARQKLAELNVRCKSHAEERTLPHDQYERGIKETGEKIWIQRLICPKCGKTVAILPDFLRPYKQYGANEIEEVLIAAETTSAYDIETPASKIHPVEWTAMGFQDPVKRTRWFKNP